MLTDMLMLRRTICLVSVKSEASHPIKARC